MDLGKKIKTIEPSYNLHLVELLLGAFSASLFFIKPIKENILEQRSFFGIPAEYFFLVLGIMLVIYSALKFFKRNPDSRIEIYENGLEVGTFRSTFDNFTIRTKGNGFTFSNETEQVDYKERLNKASYNYIKNLG